MAHAETVLSNVLDKVAREQNYENHETKLSKLPNEGANFTSFIYEATISAENKKDLHLFAKVAAVGEVMRSQAPMKMFEIEAYFYETLLKKYKKLEEIHNIEEKDRLITPKCYATHPTLYEETVALEDLRAKGFETLNRFELLTWEYASAAISELAKLHALSFAYAQEDPEGFKKDTTKLKFECPMSQELMEQVFGGMIQKSIAVVSEENRPKFEKFLNQLTVHDIMEKYFMPNEASTIALRHGDYRASNLMHRNNKDGSVTMIPIDFQTIQSGEPLNDLFYLVFSGTDRQFRAVYWTRLLDHYYHQLSSALTRLGLDPDKVYSRNVFDDSVKKVMPYGLVVAITILPLVTVDVAPEVGADSDVETFMDMNMSQAYQERLNGIISDYIEWGLL